MKYRIHMQEALVWTFDIEAPHGADRTTLEEIAYEAWGTDEVQDKKDWVDGDEIEIVGIDVIDNPEE